MFHYSVNMFHRMFSIPMTQARDIVVGTWMSHKCRFLPKLHLTVDTFSGFIWHLLFMERLQDKLFNITFGTIAVMGHPRPEDWTMDLSIYHLPFKNLMFNGDSH